MKYLAYPYDDEWVLWYLEDMVGSGDGIASFHSKLYSDFRINPHPRDVHLSEGSGHWSVFIIRIYQPTVYDRKELLFSYDNTEGTTPVKSEYTGISKTNTTTESNTVITQMDLEIETIFSVKALSLLPGADLPVRRGVPK